MHGPRARTLAETIAASRGARRSNCPPQRLRAEWLNKFAWTLFALAVALTSCELVVDPHNPERTVYVRNESGGFMLGRLQELVLTWWYEMAPQDSRRTVNVQRVLDRLVKANELPNCAFKIALTEGPLGAALPCGTIVISSGVLDACRTEDELAGLLASELAQVEGKYVLRASALNLWTIMLFM